MFCTHIRPEDLALRRLHLVLCASLVLPAALCAAPAQLDLKAIRFAFVKTPKDAKLRPFELRLDAPDTNLYTVRGDGSDLKDLTGLANASVRRPAVSYDGQRIVFSMTPRGSLSRWHIYETRADGSGLRQITTENADDLDPFYLPDGRIGFLSTRPGFLDEYHRELATMLFTMAPDGSDVRRISFNLSHDLMPQVFADGRIYYRRWEHRNSRINHFPIFTVRPDGTEAFSHFGLRQASAGLREFCELPDGRLLMVRAKASGFYRDRAATFFGTLVTADPRLGMDSELVPFGDDEWLYRSPSVLPDGRIAVARGGRTDATRAQGGIAVLDPDGTGRQIIYDDPEMIELFPVPLVPRQPPPMAPSYVDLTRTTGTVAAISVFRSELRNFAGELRQPMGSVMRRHAKSIRIVEGLPARAGRPRPRSRHSQLSVPLNAEVSLGEVPIQPDGSFFVEVPAGRALIFQALDENGMNLTFHKSWVSVMPGENRLCMGCHEHRDHAPLNQMPQALRKLPVRIVGSGEPVTYLGSVASILERKCWGCHSRDKGKPAADLVLRGRPHRTHPLTNTTDGEIAKHVSHHFARDSYLIWKIYGRALSSGKTRHAAVPPEPKRLYRGSKMPPAGAPPLTDDERRTLVLWIDLGARYADFPIERPEPPAAAPSPPKPPPPRLPVDRSYAYKSPTRIVLSRDGRRLFVSNTTAGSVSAVDTAAARVMREIAVGREPAGLAVAPDARTLYVALRGEHAVAAVDIDKGKVLARTQVGYEPFALCLTRDGARLLVTHIISGDVSIVDAASMKEQARIAVSREPRAVALSNDGRLALVANALSPEPATKPDVAAAISVIDMAGGKVTAEVRTVDGNMMRDIAVAPDGRTAYVVHQVPRFNVPTTQIAQGWIQTNGLSIIALDGTPRLVGTVLLDTMLGGAANPCGAAISPDSRTLYVSHTGTHEISVVDLPRVHAMIAERAEEAKDRLDPGLTDPRDLARDLGALSRAKALRRWGAGGLGPTGIALSPKGDRLYVANRFSDTVTVLDTATGRLLQTLRVGPEKPMSTVRRGEFLFHDARTSCFQGWLSCASCHPDVAADGLNWDLLNDGMGNRKNTKSLIGSHETPPMMSTGVRGDMPTAVAKGFHFIQFRSHTAEEQHAVVEFLKWVRHRPSPFHRNPDGSLDAPATRGKALFDDQRVGCSPCHPAPLFTDKQLADVGTRGPEDRRDRFDTPSLREIYRTAPYLHDGRAATLRDVLTAHNKGGRHGATAHLTPEQIADLVAYLKSL